MLARLLLLVALAAAVPLSAQQRLAKGDVRPRSGSDEAAPPPTRAATPPVLDGKGDDAVWSTAREITAFRQFDPIEDGEPAFRTEAKVAYDDRYLYVLVRAHDPHPDSIVALLSRRDVRTPSDHIKVMIDSYNDRRTGYEFAINPAGVKRDFYMFNDSEEDPSWDAVWDVATAIDSLGWVAEFRIPFSQLRFANGAEHTFRLGIWRDIGRTQERISWPLFRRSKPGISSQLAEVPGFVGIPSPKRLEVVPYTVAKSITQSEGDAYGHPGQLTGGADIKYGLTSNLTVDGTINPDFGQVEADPAVLNLSAFEQFFEERRPFFLEGTGIFRFDMSCSDDRCNGLFYSRRIGRSPQLLDEEDGAGNDYSDDATPSATTILGAAKLTGRLRRGLSVGFLNALTQREVGVASHTVEPRSNYAVGRLQQEFRDGNSVVGVMATGVKRGLDQWSQDFLRRDAYAGGADFRHRFAGNRYQVTGWVAASRIAGSDSAIARTQRNGVHYFQRPDGALAYDAGRSSLTGHAEQVFLNKISGIVRASTGYTRYSPGFEINDVGFLPRADLQSYNSWIGLQYNTPKYFYRRAFVNFNQWSSWNTAGLRTDFGGNVNAHAEFKNRIWAHLGYGVDYILPTYDDRAARGGPAVRQSRSPFGWFGLEGDPRRAITPYLFTNFGRGDGGRSSNYSIDPRLEFRIKSQLSMSIGPSYTRRINDAQWYDNLDDAAGTTHYTFAHLDQRSLGITTRFNYTATPTLSLQAYAEPFISSRDYSNLREPDRPRSARYQERFKRYVENGIQVEPEDENYKQFRSNTVLRWEYRPGSVLFVVWAQGRDQDGVNPGTFGVRRDGRDLFAAHPDNTFLLKTSYWFNF
jgi:hypothetical protein